MRLKNLHYSCRQTALQILLLFALIILVCKVQAEQISVAVASNFVTTLRQLTQQFEKTSPHTVSIASASTGKLYAQIKHGAPFDIFFAADAKRPQLLEKDLVGIKGSRLTYALGALALWNPKSETEFSGFEQLRSGVFRFIAIANPKLAPYGKATQELLQREGLWNDLTASMVRGENISQTYQFVESGHADLGFVAYSQIALNDIPEASYWLIPETFHEPIEQQAVLLSDSSASRKFLAFVGSEKGREIIQNNGYRLPR